MSGVRPALGTAEHTAEEIDDRGVDDVGALSLEIMTGSFNHHDFAADPICNEPRLGCGICEVGVALPITTRVAAEISPRRASTGA